MAAASPKPQTQNPNAILRAIDTGHAQLFINCQLA
jgi:hypothetical protein